jgi:hypothetical protein
MQGTVFRKCPGSFSLYLSLVIAASTPISEILWADTEMLIMNKKIQGKIIFFMIVSLGAGRPVW